MKKLIQLTILLLSVFYVQSQAQTDRDNTIETITKDGKIVILKSDGTWAFKAETSSPDDLNQTNGFGTVYFYRLKENEMFNTPRSVKLNNKEIFKINQNRFIGVKLKAGKYILEMNQKQSEFLLEVEPSKNYFILVSVNAVGFGRSDILTEINEKTAIFQMRNLNGVEDSKIKSDNLIFVKEKPVNQ